MALWDALAPAATVAQLVGADAVGLVSATLQAVRTARRNRKECRSLARRVMMVGDLLQLVQQGSSATLRRPEVGRALNGLGDALRRAFELVESCQERGAAYGFVMAGRQAEQFRDVQAEIDSYLLVFPMLSHIDVTIRLERIYNMLLPPDHSQPTLEAVPGLPTRHVDPYARNEGDDMAFGRLQSSLTETIEAQGYQRTGHQETLEELLTKDQRLKWLCWLPQKIGSSSKRQVDIKNTAHHDHYAYDLLKAATNNFSSLNKIGSGGWSTVYMAHIGGLEVAIKRYPTGAGSQASCEFNSEFEIQEKLQHKNIIKLLGHCTVEGEGILVYEYMPNGSLDKFVFGDRHGSFRDWMSRFHIMEGIAQGLLYLHTHEPCIVHKDLKPSNILLDSDMNAKISDFGIAKTLCTGSYIDTYISGTLGYMAPEHLRQGIISPKVDVYAYGIILLEVISGKKSSVPWLQDVEYVALTEHAWNLWATVKLSEFIDPLLHNGDEIIDITKCIQIALLCVQDCPEDRPSMSDVLLMLGNKMTIPSPKQVSRQADANEYHVDGYTVRGADGYASEATWSSSDITWPR